MRFIAISLTAIALACGCRQTTPATNSAKFPPEIEEAIRDFQNGSREANDYATARKLLPLLKPGLSKREVQEILGQPNKVTTGETGHTHWDYALFYSQFIVITFDNNDNIKTITSTIANK